MWRADARMAFRTIRGCAPCPAGAQIVKVAPRSIVITGTMAEWSRWTGLRFTASGAAIVPGVSLERDHAVYVEPNLWVHHRLI
jgi:hypothetical protein